MKVLQQLIQHFWVRGALTAEQAHYLVEHGFARPGDLENYQPRDLGEEAGSEDTGRADLPGSEVLLPDDKDVAEDHLVTETARKWKSGGKGAPKVPDVTPELLGLRLEELLAAREDCFPALAELAGAASTQKEGGEAAVILRHLPETIFHQRLLHALQARPGILAELWECVDDEPFHALLERPGAKGRAIRSFEAILRSSRPGEWGAAAWILKVSAVQTIANLLAVRRLLLGALPWLYDNHWRNLARCLQRPTHQRRSWEGLGFGLVLVYNARARLTNRPPPGFQLEKRLAPDRWREAWTMAMAIEPVAMTPYLLHIFGGLPGVTDAEAGNLAAREDVLLICPFDWKV